MIVLLAPLQESPAVRDAAQELVARGADWVRLTLEAAGVVIIAIGGASALAMLIGAALSGRTVSFTGARLTLARFLALALEFQLAADILETSIAPEWRDIGQLAAIATIRTALNFFLSREIRDEREQTRAEMAVASRDATASRDRPA